MNVQQAREHIEKLATVERFKFATDVFKLAVCEYVRQDNTMEYDKWGIAKVKQHGAEAESAKKTLAHIGEMIGLDTLETMAILEDVESKYNVGSEVSF